MIKINNSRALKIVENSTKYVPGLGRIPAGDFPDVLIDTFQSFTCFFQFSLEILDGDGHGCLTVSSIGGAGQ